MHVQTEERKGERAIYTLEEGCRRETHARYAWSTLDRGRGGASGYVARGGGNFVGIGIKVIREAFVSSCN